MRSGKIIVSDGAEAPVSAIKCGKCGGRTRQLGKILPDISTYVCKKCSHVFTSFSDDEFQSN